MLVEIKLTKPAGTIAGGLLTLTQQEDGLISATGIATWARIKNGNGEHGWDCAVSDLAGSAPLKMASTQLYAGGYARIVSGSLR